MVHACPNGSQNSPMITPSLLNDILASLSDEYERVGSSENHRIEQVCSIDQAISNSIVWCHPSRPEKAKAIENTLAQVVICDREIEANHLLECQAGFSFDDSRFIKDEAVLWRFLCVA